MSFGYSCNIEKGFVLSVCEGSTTVDQLSAHFRQLHADTRIQQISNFLVDFRSARIEASMGEFEIQRMANLFLLDSREGAMKKIGVLAHSEFSKFKLVERLLPSRIVTFITFNSLDTACTWLGIDSKQIEREIVQLQTTTPGIRTTGN